MSKPVALIVVAALALALSACTANRTSQSSVVDVGNAALGLAYAEQTCASCHAVAPAAMRSPNPLARPFDAIANTPGFTRTALNAWLHSSHATMPDLLVEPERIDDLYAYLSSLKQRR